MLILKAWTSPAGAIHQLLTQGSRDRYRLAPTRVYLARLQSELAQRRAIVAETNRELDESSALHGLCCIVG